MWCPSKNGEFTVRSVAVLPPKVKNFIWRCCRGCIPTRMRLREIDVQCPTLCAICGANLENSWHIFFSCRRSMSCWNREGLWDAIDSYMDSTENFFDPCFEVCSMLSKPKVVNFVVVLWSIWISRNTKIWDAKD